jgi:hypothetical protein
MKLHFMAPYPRDQAPSQRLKFEQNCEHFEQAGFGVIQDAF